MVERPFYTRSAWEADQRCRRSRYWSTEYGRRGITPKAHAFELHFGSLVHEAIAEFLQVEPQDEEAITVALRKLESHLGDLPDDVAARHRTNLEGMLRAWLRVVRPVLRQRYDVLYVEEAVAYDHHGVTLGSTPDTVVRERDSGLIVYIEWKTTRNIDERWLQSWHRQPQLVAGIKGVLAARGLIVDHAYIVGLYKGYLYKGEFYSPYVTGWRRMGVTGFEYQMTRPQSWKGWERFDVASEPGGIRWWVEEACTVEQLGANIAWTTPITPDPQLMDGWLRQSAHRELELATLRELYKQPRSLPERELDRAFPQNFGACEPAWGIRCPYLECCWLRHIADDPLSSGLYQWREPHNPLEPRRWERPVQEETHA